MAGVGPQRHRGGGGKRFILMGLQLLINRECANDVDM